MFLLEFHLLWLLPPLLGAQNVVVGAIAPEADRFHPVKQRGHLQPRLACLVRRQPRQRVNRVDRGLGRPLSRLALRGAVAPVASRQVVLGKCEDQFGRYWL